MSNKKKKICMVVQDPLTKGGIAAVVNGYRGSILEKDFEVIYVESYKDGGKLKKLFKSIRGYFHFIKVLLVNNPDLIHIHSSFGASFYRKLPFIYLASWFKKPIINHIHGAEFETFYRNTTEKKKRLIKKVYNKCSILIALSEEWKARLKLIVSEERIHVIENYSMICNDAVKEKNKTEPNNQVLFLGEIGKRKGCYDIPAVVQKVAAVVPNVKFVLAGTGDIEEIKALLKDKGVEQYVTFPGWVRGTEKDEFLRTSDIFFLPSYNEGMPMSILDAMGYGLPIVSTNVGGISKIVRNGKNGYVCKPGDVNEFANCIIEMLKDKHKLKDFSTASYEIVKEQYSLETHLKMLEELYTILGRNICEKSI
ncbi:glycosyltransferase family 4 protein [Bacillus testis]|uniref:glycosyltransferase family 4 protein n=1 Tax=Bacillus testis TaxID=1622072 RepID=UPI00067EEE24|nr:glycosyltransferase family 4 protein [Bacillus testis]